MLWIHTGSKWKSRGRNARREAFEKHRTSWVHSRSFGPWIGSRCRRHTTIFSLQFRCSFLLFFFLIKMKKKYPLWFCVRQSNVIWPEWQSKNAYLPMYLHIRICNMPFYNRLGFIFLYTHKYIVLIYISKSLINICPLQVNYYIARINIIFIKNIGLVHKHNILRNVFITSKSVENLWFLYKLHEDSMFSSQLICRCVWDENTAFQPTDAK